MNTHTKWTEYKKLELIDDLSLKQHNHSIRSWLSNLGKSIVCFLFQENEPRIFQVIDQTGQLWWNVYDPRTGQFFSLSSEEDLRIWLEQRYYCRKLNHSELDWKTFYRLR